MIIKLFLIITIGLYCIGCSNSSNAVLKLNAKEVNIECTDSSCTGSYKGAEFINGSDVAHQLSNLMCDKVGDKLKELYEKEAYSIVNFSKIVITTEGMGSGNVIYELTIPFKTVDEKCNAFTSFDHVGGWNHTPALSDRKIQLQSELMKGEKLNISKLKQTPEGLQEYWIQWKNKNTQANCVNRCR